MILKHLKQATGLRHAALESRLPLLDAGMSRLSYLHFLQRFYGYYAPLESQLLALPYWNSMDFDYAGRHKTPRLVQDLRALGETPEAIQGFARCQHLPTLGGQIITRHLEANLGLTPLTGASFFDGYGARTGSQWKVFCAMLRGNAGESGRQDDILSSASQTFETLGQWLFPPCPTPRGGTP